MVVQPDRLRHPRERGTEALANFRGAETAQQGVGSGIDRAAWLHRHMQQNLVTRVAGLRRESLDMVAIGQKREGKKRIERDRHLGRRLDETNVVDHHRHQGRGRRGYGRRGQRQWRW